MIGFVALLVGAWLVVDPGWPEPERAWRNLGRFAQEATPPWSLAWWGRVVRLDVVANTVALGVLGTGLAAAAGALAAFAAAPTVATPRPWSTDDRAPLWTGLGWALLRGGTRIALLFLRAIPVYVWAFLLVGLLGPSPWSAVLALALHNGGILGRLFAETVDDVEPAAPRALWALGASRRGVAMSAVLPQVHRRWLLYVFVRWESCIREATVVGLVGIVSLGWAIREARARTHYDEMVALVLVGALMIVVADAISIGARASGRARWWR